MNLADGRRFWLALGLFIVMGTGQLRAEELPPGTPAGEGEAPALQISLTDKWSVLHKPGRARPGVFPLPEKGSLQSIPEFALTGPMPGHPFGLGEFVANGTWGMTQGAVTVVAEKNAVLKLTAANQFEMEGVITSEGLGGWFLLFGWNQGHGYSLSNFVLRDSPSPWFLTEYRAAKAIPNTNQEIKSFEWRGEQPMFLSVVQNQLNLKVGTTVVVKEFPLEDYTPGEVYLGTYDTRYGARTVAVKSLRVRDPVFTPVKSVPEKKAIPGKKIAPQAP
ncbi:MAG: hypothetical protein DWH91_11000 [Planctomycetota bacterium]|nr:MAG: hypothetical protein DWH91_11000 [Planctomycetota bacterium]